VLIDVGGHAVLTDYGLLFVTETRDFTATVSARPCRWTAPEIQAGHGTPTLASDVFSYAMTVIEVSFFFLSSQLALDLDVFQVISGSPPFAGKKWGDIVLKIVAGILPDIPVFIQEQLELANLLARCWHLTPQTRPSVHEICQVLATLYSPPVLLLATAAYN